MSSSKVVMALSLPVVSKIYDTYIRNKEVMVYTCATVTLLNSLELWKTKEGVYIGADSNILRNENTFRSQKYWENVHIARTMVAMWALVEQSC